MNHSEYIQSYFYQLKEDYPNTMYHENFEDFYLYETNRIQSQIDDGYLDISDTSGDEFAFIILKEAVRLYKEKYNIK